MNPPPNHDSPHWEKQHSHPHQKENALERKSITAEKLQEIFTMADSFSQKKDINTFDRTAIENNIKKSGLQENIMLITIPEPLFGVTEINIFTFKDLEIKGDVKITLSNLKTIEFTNNVFLHNKEILFAGATDTAVIFTKNEFLTKGIEINLLKLGDVKFINNTFSENVKITVTDKIDMNATDADATNTAVIFHKNTFSNSFDFNVSNAALVHITHNRIKHKMSVFFRFTSFLDDHNYRKIHKTPSGAQRPEFFIGFEKNTINHLDISDKSKSSYWTEQSIPYPLAAIKFQGGNRLRILTINTKHTILSTYALNANVNSISFKASDEIGISVPTTDSTSDNIGDPFLRHITKNYQLTYGKFFSLLEKQASEQHDSENEDIYRRKVRYFKKKFSSRWEDRVIFGWTNLISRDGTSWVRPIVCLVLIEMILATIAWYFLILIQWDLYYSWQEGGKVFLTLLTWFMNPASLLPLPVTLDPKTIANSWLIYLLFLLQKASVALFYYEIIKVLRRFTK